MDRKGEEGQLAEFGEGGRVTRFLEQSLYVGGVGGVRVVILELAECRRE